MARTTTRGIRFYDSPTAFSDISYAALDADARARAVQFALLGLRPGDAAILAFEPGLPFVRALMACLYAGVIAAPVPIMALRNTDAVRARLFAIARDSRAKIVLTTAGALMPLGLADDDNVEGATVVIVDGAAQADPALWTVPEVEESATAILQYTSGSTGTPKGVMVSQGNLLANQRAINSVVKMSSDSVLVGWLPHYHDMGLIGQILQPIYTTAALYMTSPSQFLRRPLQWLRLLTQVRATHTVGPDFAFALCSRIITDEQRAELDLSSLEGVITGAEPVRIQTLNAFAERFGPIGFRSEAFIPAFGLAETTLLVTGRHAGQPPKALVASADGIERDVLVPAQPGERSLSFVLCGPPAIGMDVAIVDPVTSTRLNERLIGEIWVRGASVTQGYWNRPDETTADFGATIEGNARETYLRTGDLGALVDGELVITGRLKDLIIIRGRNIYPQDLELAADGLLAPGCLCAAFELPGSATEIGMVAEIEGALVASGDFASLGAELRRSISQEFTLANLGVALIRKGLLPRTTSGKVQRALTRKLLLEQQLAVIHTDGFEAVSI
ncbi:fatty acyl-AMP ligase [Micromonospora sp. DT81.3]|uniref:fatty acyl-AMP ligase n=1 Tax=Micromonospora sp. DT81.3 TaxID=3416523 RepID=UPI003CF24847